MQPLGPGFRFSDRQTEISASAEPTEQLHIRVVDDFDNVGHFPLRSIEFRVSEDVNNASQKVRVTVDGKEVSLSHGSNAVNGAGKFTDAEAITASFEPAWEEQQLREIVTEWDLKSELAAPGSEVGSAAAFYLADRAALPLWQVPSGFLAEGGPTPNHETLTVLAPADFRVLAPGEPLKPVVTGNVVTHRFRIRPSRDHLPYVVAGRYQEQVIRARQSSVSFWTFQPLDPQQARTAAARLWSSMRAFEDFFGPTNGDRIVHIVEAPGQLPAEFGEVESDSGGLSFPNGVLLDSRLLSKGIASEGVLRLSEYELARTWFGWRVRPVADAQILMGRGVGLFGVVVAAEARGQDQRLLAVASLLQQYDQAREIATDKPMIEPPYKFSRDERISTSYKAALFLVALEDLCDRDNTRAAFREIVRARANDDVGYEELRAALESTSRRDLAGIFDAWLNQPGIPNDFRLRYSKDSAYVETGSQLNP